MKQRRRSSLARYRKLVAQWHPTRNGALKPSDVTVQTKRKVWWKCAKGPDHTWRAVIASRAQGNGCPFCSNFRVSRTNSLAALHPDVARTWHRQKNGGRSARDVVAGSAKKAWWKCSGGPDHEWTAEIRIRAAGRGRCPFCAGRRASSTHSLASLWPRIAREWHPERDGCRTPRDTVATTRVVVWWRCALLHVWQAPVRNRTVGGQGCPVCSRGAMQGPAAENR